MGNIYFKKKYMLQFKGRIFEKNLKYFYITTFLKHYLYNQKRFTRWSINFLPYNLFFFHEHYLHPTWRNDGKRRII